MKYILLLAMSITLQFQDGSEITEDSQLRSKYFDTQEECRNAGAMWEFNKFRMNTFKAKQHGATILSQTYDHECVLEQAQ